MTPRVRYGVRIASTFLAVGCAAALASSRSFFDQALVDSFFAFALASVFLLHLRIRPKWSDASLVFAGLLFFAFLDFKLLHFPPSLMAWLSFLGLASFLVMGVRALWADEPGETRRVLYAWIPAFLFVASDYFASSMLDWTARAHPKTLDLYLLSFDDSLRVPLASIAGQAYLRHPWLHNAGLLAYVALAVPITVVYAGRLVRFGERAFSSMLAFLITGPAGVLLYNLFPACGPHALFKQAFPFQMLPIADAQRVLLEPVAIAGARNAIPSLHMAWVLLAWWYSRGLSWLERLCVFAFLLLTVFATLGTGEHWFVDLVVAFPFALLVQSACAWPFSKRFWHLAAVALGLGAVSLWLVLLRYAAQFFWTSPIIPWGFAASTVALTMIRQAKLDQLERLPAGSVARSNSAGDHEQQLSMPVGGAVSN